MRRSNKWIESWRGWTHPYQRPRNLESSQRILPRKVESEEIILFVAKLCSLMMAGKIEKPKSGEKIRVQHKK